MSTETETVTGGILLKKSAQISKNKNEITESIYFSEYLSVPFSNGSSQVCQLAIVLSRAPLFYSPSLLLTNLSVLEGKG